MIGSGIFTLPAQLAPYGWTGVAAWFCVIAGAVVVALVLSRLAEAMPQATGAVAMCAAALGPLYIRADRLELLGRRLVGQRVLRRDRDELSGGLRAGAQRDTAGHRHSRRHADLADHPAQSRRRAYLGAVPKSRRPRSRSCRCLPSSPFLPAWCSRAAPHSLPIRTLPLPARRRPARRTSPSSRWSASRVHEVWWPSACAIRRAMSCVPRSAG